MKFLVATLLETILKEDGLRSLDFDWNGRRLGAILYIQDGELTAFLNICPHWGIPLGPLEAVLEAASRQQPPALRCLTHSARFSLPSGICVWGPCEGDGLDFLPVCLALGRVFLYLPHRLRINP